MRISWNDLFEKFHKNDNELLAAAVYNAGDNISNEIEKGFSALTTAISSLSGGGSDTQGEIHEILTLVKSLKEKGEQFMAKATDALAGLKAQIAQLQTDYKSEETVLTAVLADVAKLVAGASVLPNGQVAVAQADLDALTQSVTNLDAGIQADTVGETAADQSVNPPVVTPGPLTLVPGSLALTAGGAAQAVSVMDGATDITASCKFAIADTTIALVDGAGNVSGELAGSTTLTATSPDGRTVTVPVTVS